MAAFWDYFSVLAPSIGLGLIFWLVMRSLLRSDTGERESQARRLSGADARAAREEAEAREWAARRRAEGGPEADPEDRARAGAGSSILLSHLTVGAYALLVLANFAFYWPVWTAQVIPYDHWRWRMWFPSWV